MSAIDNFEVPESGNNRIRPPSTTKLIHFSDGSTMEVQDVDQDEVDRMRKLVKEPEIHQCHQQAHSICQVDPKSLTWPEWLKHVSKQGGSSVLSGLEYSGETLAYYLGITSPKYQSEIDEYNRMVTKRAAEVAEVKAWASSDPASVPIVMEQVRSEKEDWANKRDSRENSASNPNEGDHKV